MTNFELTYLNIYPDAHTVYQNGNTFFARDYAHAVELASALEAKFDEPAFYQPINTPARKEA